MTMAIYLVSLALLLVSTLINIKSILAHDGEYFVDPKEKDLSPWSDWTPCRENCTTTRFRTCIIKSRCDDYIETQEQSCFATGTECEKIYLSGRKQPSENNSVDAMKSDYSKLDEFLIHLRAIECKPYIDIFNSVEINYFTKAAEKYGFTGVTLYDNSMKSLGEGTVISPNWILASAGNLETKMLAKLRDAEKSPTFRISEIYIHPKYNGTENICDQALLKVRGPFNPFVKWTVTSE